MTLTYFGMQKIDSQRSSGLRYVLVAVILFSQSFVENNNWFCPLWFKVLFSEMDTANQLDPMEMVGIGEKEGLPIEAFAKVQEMFSHVDWLDPTGDAAIQLFQRLTSSESIQLRQGFLSPSKKEIESLDLELISPTKQSGSAQQKSNHIEQSTESYGGQISALSEQATDSHVKTGISVIQESLGSLVHKVDIKTEQPSSLDKAVPSTMNTVEPVQDDQNDKLDEQCDSVQHSLPAAIISQRFPISSSVSDNSSPKSLSASPRFHSVPSALGITALLEDHAACGGSEKSASTITSPTVSKPSGEVEITSKLPSGQHPTTGLT
jgi:hypothetical protein